MRTRTRNTLNDLALALAVLAALVVLAMVAVRAVPSLQCAVQRTTPLAAPHSDDWYVDFGRGKDGLGYWLLYLGVGESVDNAKQADVLLVGNSRTLFAFPAESLEAFRQETGLAVYNLGFGYSEAYRFPLAVMERWDMRPRLVVANADGFFASEPSGLAMQVLHRGWTGYMERVVNERAGATYDSLAGRLPDFTASIPLACPDGPPPGYILRSVSTGAWLPVDYAGTPEAVDPDRGAVVVTDRELENAREFKKRVEALGARLVLTHVPSAKQTGSRGRAGELARLLDVPLVAPLPDGLMTLDQSHLDRDSASRFSRAFFEALAAEPGLLQ